MTVTNCCRNAEEANKFFDEAAPWKLIKEDTDATKEVLSLTIHWFRILAIYLKPVIPSFSAKVEDLLSETFTWESLSTYLNPDLEIKKFQHLATRIDIEMVQKVIDEGKG